MSCSLRVRYHVVQAVTNYATCEGDRTTWLEPRSAPTLAAVVTAEEDQERRRAIGARLRQLRERRPQDVVARAIGVTPRAYQRWETGESNMRWPNIVAAAQFYGVSEQYLLHGASDGDADDIAAYDPSQLDRIEAKLDQVLALMRPTLLEAAETLRRELETAVLERALALTPSAEGTRPEETQAEGQGGAAR